MNSNNGSQYRWISLPPDYGVDTADGQLLTDAYTNFPTGTNITPNVKKGWQNKDDYHC